MPDDQKPAGETPAPTTTPNQPPAPAPAARPVEENSMKAYIEDLKTESIQNRLRAKSESERAAKAEEALGSQKAAFGRALLDREIALAAMKAGLRKPELAAKLLPDLDGIEVDLETFAVKGDIGAKLDALKKDVPELFGAMPQPAPAAPKPPAGTQDPGSPSAGALGSILEEWEAAKATGDRAAMNRLMTDPVKGKAIGAHIDSMRPRH